MSVSSKTKILYVKRKVYICAYMFNRWINIMNKLYLLERKYTQGTPHINTNKQKTTLFTIKYTSRSVLLIYIKTLICITSANSQKLHILSHILY